MTPGSSPGRLCCRLVAIIGKRNTPSMEPNRDDSGCKRVAPLKEQIVQARERNGGRRISTMGSPPEAILRALGSSKKGFKQAVGALYQSRFIPFQRPGMRLLKAPDPGRHVGV